MAFCYPTDRYSVHKLGPLQNKTLRSISPDIRQPEVMFYIRFIALRIVTVKSLHTVQQCCINRNQPLIRNLEMGHILLSFSLRMIRINVYMELVIVKDGGSFYSILDTEEKLSIGSYLITNHFWYFPMETLIQWWQKKAEMVLS